MADGVKAIPHKAARLLDYLQQKGAGVDDANPPVDKDLSSTSCASRLPQVGVRDHAEFVCEELLEFCAQGYWVVLPLSVVQDWPNLRLSPMGVVPQRKGRPRLIVDYTFSNVNQETLRLAPPEAMQFGRALQRVMTNIVHADPRYGPTVFG